MIKPLAPARGSVNSARGSVKSAGGSAASGVLLSIDRVASTVAEKSELRQTGADAVEMEAAGVAQKAIEYNLPFYCIRVVTDTANEDFPLDFNLMRDSAGRFNRMKILMAGWRVFPRLLELNKRSKAASQALGDFLDSIHF